MYLRTGIRYVGKGQKMMKYENGRLVLEIPAHIEEFDTIDLSAMFTYIVRKNPEIIKQMEIEKLSMETVLQEYYKIISHESLWLLARKYTKEYNGVKQVVSDTPEAGMAYRQLGETLEAELGEALKRDGYYADELGIELGIEEEERLKKEQLIALWRTFEESMDAVKEKVEVLEGINLGF